MSLYLPIEVQKKLICSQCHKQLSRFPVYTNVSSNDSVCGRCPLPDKNKYHRNKLYEDIACHNKFICCNKANGCLEYLFPKEVERHEKFCKYRKYDCPLGKQQCTWQGYSNELLEHFEQNHNNFILQDGKFEVDFVNSHNENYLFPFSGDELFNVTRKVDSKTNKFTCQVSYIGRNYVVDDYYYVLLFRNVNGERSHKVIKKINAVCEFGGNDLSNLLNNPGVIIAEVNIQDKEKSNESDCENADNSDIDFPDLEEFECPTCLEYLLPPVFQCDIGHSICGKCKEGLEKKECPTCKSPFGKTRNFVLENIILKKTYPCKYAKCRFSCKARDIRQHQSTCIYGPYSCPLFDILDCSESMPITEIHDHIVNNHYEYLLEFDVVYTPFEGENDTFKECYILQHSLRLFRLIFLYQHKKLLWSLQLIGQAEESVKFKFEIDISDNANKNRLYLKGNCTQFCDINTCFNNDKIFLYLNYDQIKQFITDVFCYRVRILHD